MATPVIAIIKTYQENIITAKLAIWGMRINTSIKDSINNMNILFHHLLHQVTHHLHHQVTHHLLHQVTHYLNQVLHLLFLVISHLHHIIPLPNQAIHLLPQVIYLLHQQIILQIHFLTPLLYPPTPPHSHIQVLYPIHPAMLWSMFLALKMKNI